MANHGKWGVGARVLVEVNLRTFSTLNAVVERLRPDVLGDVPNQGLLKIAEIERNRLPGLLNYVGTPGTPAQP